MLADCKDFHCYYTDAACSCKESDIIWFSGGSTLFWYDLQTGDEHFVCNLPEFVSDITWMPDGKLYGLAYWTGRIYELDPYTGDTTFVRSLPADYYFGNGMTADYNGNLYLTVITPGTPKWHVIKLDISSGNYSVIADLSSLGLKSSGDLTFLNGSIYVMCERFALAKINVATHAIQVSTILNGGNSNVYGLVSVGDSDLYFGAGFGFSRLDTLTMQATLIHTFDFSYGYISGMANYQEPCQSPSCRLATVKIDTLSSAPYCAASGMLLKGTGRGISGTSGYEWILPGGSRVSGDSLRVSVNGMYKLRYYSSSVGCGVEDSVNINLIQNPVSSLGNDTVICPGDHIVLQSGNNNNVSNYLWQDGSAGSQLNVSAPGLYWLETSNACGVSRDSIVVSPLQKPVVNLGTDKELCSDDTLVLYNLIPQDGLQYLWQNSFTGDTLVVRKPGEYWVKAGNSCGTANDTIVIGEKVVDCICQLFIPNSFTPNDDGLNDNIKVLSNCDISGEIFIYNRWGELVYYSKDLQRGWNGIYNGKRQPSDVYVYQVNYSYQRTHGKYFKKGSFVLIR